MNGSYQIEITYSGGKHVRSSLPFPWTLAASHLLKRIGRTLLLCFRIAMPLSPVCSRIEVHIYIGRNRYARDELFPFTAEQRSNVKRENSVFWGQYGSLPIGPYSYYYLIINVSVLVAALCRHRFIDVPSEQLLS